MSDIPEAVSVDESALPVAEVLEEAAVDRRARCCPACHAPMEPGASFCTTCGNRLGKDEEFGEDIVQTGFKCDRCGAAVQVEAGQRAYQCAFCDSTYVVEFKPEGTRQRPEFVVPFAITKEEALKRFKTWVGTGWFTPKNLVQIARAGELKGVYLPFWSFSARAESEWSARIGEHWYETVTETYTTRDSQGRTVTKTRTKRVQHTEWYGLSGRWHGFQHHYLVSASKGLSQEWVEEIVPFDLLRMSRFRPYILAGWASEEYVMEREEARNLSLQRYDGQVKRKVAGFLPGDTHTGLTVHTQFFDVTSDLILLPIWIAAYQYNGKTFRFVLNGQTGSVTGDKPTSWIKVTLTVVAVVIVIVLFLLATSR
ncbi:MAG: zinc ribbon domain-containing protein [Planctomycetes bacterium]|nr:zinc ribbon domain-containing protein [Planctomycetota bacterium]